jgi:hypothetical protein
MERSLLYGALALGCVGYACAIALTHGSPRAESRSTAPVLARPFIITAVLLPLLVFLATLPTRAPFASGHGFGSGFGMGAIGALLAGWLIVRSLRASRDVPLFGAAVSAGPLSAAVAVTATAQLMLHAELIDALAGVAIGWFCVSITLIAGFVSSQSQPSDLPRAVLPLASAAGFTAAVCSIATLGAFRGGEDFAADRWSAAGIALAAGVPFAIYLCSITAPLFARIGLKTPFPRLFTWLTQRLVSTEDGRAAAARVWRAMAATLILLGLAKLLSTRALDQPHLFTAALAGVLAGWVCWWLVAEGRAVRSGDDGPVAPQFVPIAVLLLLGVGVVAFNQLAGFGVGVAVISAWLSFGMAQAFVAESRVESAADSADTPSSSLQGLLHLLFFGLGFLLFRLVTTRFADDLKGVGLADHYGIAGFLAGSVVPVLLAALMPTGGRPARSLARLIVIGLLTLAIPATALILWRSKVAVALVAGLGLATVAPLWNRSGSRESAGFSVSALLQALLALGVMLGLSQWTHHALGFASLTRDAKVGLVTWIVGGLIVAVLTLDFGGRLASRGSNRPTPSAAVGGADK